MALKFHDFKIKNNCHSQRLHICLHQMWNWQTLRFQSTPLSENMWGRPGGSVSSYSSRRKQKKYQEVKPTNNCLLNHRIKFGSCSQLTVSYKTNVKKTGYLNNKILDILLTSFTLPKMSHNGAWNQISLNHDCLFDGSLTKYVTPELPDLTPLHYYCYY